jgi:PAS domain S-box-containing protein
MDLALDPDALRHLAFFRLGVFAASGLAILVVAEWHRSKLDRLERSRQQLRSFMAHDEVGLQVINPDGIVTWADQAAIDLLGYGPTEHIGSPMSRFHADPALARVVMARVVAGQDIENMRAPLRRKDGTTIEVLLNSNALLGNARAGGPGVLLAILPVTEPGPVTDLTRQAVTSLLERRLKASRAAREAKRGIPRPGATH